MHQIRKRMQFTQDHKTHDKSIIDNAVNISICIYVYVKDAAPSATWSTFPPYVMVRNSAARNYKLPLIFQPLLKGVQQGTRNLEVQRSRKEAVNETAAAARAKEMRWSYYKTDLVLMYSIMFQRRKMPSSLYARKPSSTPYHRRRAEWAGRCWIIHIYI